MGALPLSTGKIVHIFIQVRILWLRHQFRCSFKTLNSDRDVVCPTGVPVASCPRWWNFSHVCDSHWQWQSLPICRIKCRASLVSAAGTRLLSDVLTQTRVNSEAKNMPSVMFFKTTWHVEALGHFDYFRWAVWRHFMVLLYVFYVWILVTIRYNCLGDDRNTFFPVKLQQSFMDWKTSPSPPSAWGWGDNDWIFIFRWTIPVNMWNIFKSLHFHSVTRIHRQTVKYEFLSWNESKHLSVFFLSRHTSVYSFQVKHSVEPNWDY